MRYFTVTILALLGLQVTAGRTALRAEARDLPSSRVLVEAKGIFENSEGDFSRRFSRSLPSVEARILDLEAGEEGAAVESFRRQGLHAEPDAVLEAHALPNDEYFPEQWHLQAAPFGIEAEAAWDRAHDAGEVLIAVIDSGCELGHPDIAPNLWRNEGEIPGNDEDDDGNGFIDDVHGYDFIRGDGDPDDEAGHGSRVFGILAAAGDNGVGVAGVAWRARVMCLKVLKSDGDGNVSYAIEAIDYAVKQGAAILNLSWGYSTAAPSLFLRNALAEAERQGVLAVASAGNRGLENRTGFGETATYPASYGGAALISVASTDRKNGVSEFSNYGAESVDLAAPGEDILTTDLGGFSTFSGTSASAAEVSGAAALVWSREPELSAEEIKRRLLDSAFALDSLQGKTLAGGRLDLSAALEAEAAQDPRAGREDHGEFSMGAGEGGGGCSIQLQAGQGSGLELLLILAGYRLTVIIRRRRA